MLNLSKEEKIFVIEYAIKRLEHCTDYICECLRQGLYHYKIIQQSEYGEDEAIRYVEVLRMLPEVTQFCPEDIDWNQLFGGPWFEPNDEGHKQRIELLEKSLKLLKNETIKAR